MCRAHVREADKHHSDPEYIPVWKNERGAEVNTATCMHPDCGSTGRTISCSSEMVVTFPFFPGKGHVCERHYQQLYRQLHTLTPCSGCGKKPKVREGPYTRRSPDAITVSKHLMESGLDGNITQADTLCKACYDLHLVILRKQDKSVLKDDIALWREVANDGNTPELTRAILATVLYVANKLQQDMALLLPHVATVFLSFYSQGDREELYLVLGDGRVKFSPRWLMHQLITHLQPYMAYRCVIKKVGTLLYSKNSDVLKCLSLALHDTHSAADDFYHERPIGPQHQTTLREAGCIINEAIQGEIKRLKSYPTDLTTFNLDTSLSDCNAVLWEFVCSCTRSIRERSGRPNSDDAHVKTMRRFFIMSAMLFTTNSSCDTTLHHLVADTVEVMGGSRQLIRVLNRLGVCVSPDTHDRLVTQVAETHKSKSIWSELSPCAFTIASADNIDFLQSHAAVYCGDQSRSYHGTTIQLVQPIPSLSSQGTRINATTTPDHAQHTTVHSCLHKRHRPDSPSNSPHNHGKVGPKRRTMQLSPTKSAPEHVHIGEAAPNPTLHLDIQQFQEGKDEEDSKLKLNKQVFAYSLLKASVPELDSGTVLKPLRDFILPTPAQLADNDPSKIFYMDIYDENADSEQTMAAVAETVNDKLTSAESCQKWVVLVGDGKTYGHLQKVKRVYGSDYERLYIYPGDWHTLKNFQPVLVKAYYHAGLRDIAMASGYRGETLSSLENCSHFKRTHFFLIQVWEAMFTAMVRSFAADKPDLGLLASVKSTLVEAIQKNTTSTHDLLLNVQCLITEALALESFSGYVQEQRAADETWHLWSNFVLKDCFGYVGLFLGIRTSDWDLRLSSLKNMAALFSAYDRPCYQKLIPDHLAELQSYPAEVIDCFRAGGFTVKVKGGIGHAVALDEAHEMCINRDLKMAVARPTLPYLKKTAHFFSYRIKAHKQLMHQLFPPADKPPALSKLLDCTSCVRQWDENVGRILCSVITESKLFVSDKKKGS